MGGKASDLFSFPNKSSLALSIDVAPGTWYTLHRNFSIEDTTPWLSSGCSPSPSSKSWCSRNTLYIVCFVWFAMNDVVSDPLMAWECREMFAGTFGDTHALEYTFDFYWFLP